MAKVIQKEGGTIGCGWHSYRIDFGNGMVLWFDATDNEDESNEEDTFYTGDWNMYIFHTDNARDMEIKAFQENADNYSDALDAIQDYESLIK
jgi:hypothetical protein